ncbi:MAG: RNA 3'-terminal phosphate cyclase [Candidatus Thorarchaeota archaeon]|nr:RNA 3'-terminal phosphate cyclase [Candidatus Thorarchaeota archaeon]
MIEIDGSYGEGGGQILRTAIALSALAMIPIRITNIRAGRPKPGLKRQHMAGIELISRFANAEVKGLEVGRTELEFSPRKLTGNHFKYDVGTAGSISLVLQAVFPVAVLSPVPVQFTVSGGTDVRWSPPIDYLRAVFANHLRKMGAIIEITTVRRGHYPRGGGIVSCEVTPAEKLAPIDIVEFGDIKQVAGISHCIRLPSHVAERQASAARALLQEASLGQATIEIESHDEKDDQHVDPGSGIVLWAESESGLRIGADELGEKGVSAEEVGRKCARRLVKEMASGMAADSHLADMLVPYLALADGTSKVGVSQISEHLRTNAWVAKQILDSDIEIKENADGTNLLIAHGIGLSLRE